MQSAQPSGPALKSTQIVAGVAVVLALLGGAYAVGRSQAPLEGAPAAEAPAGDSATNTSDKRSTAATETPAAKAPVVVAQAPTPARRDTAAPRETPVLSPAERERQSLARLCERCALVTDVHAETRRGQGSGLGAVGGAVVGGLLGNMVGGGNGRKLATVGGAVAGGYAGNEIEKSQKTHTVWVVQAKDRDGRVHRFERSSDPGVQSGDEIALLDGGGFSTR